MFILPLFRSLISLVEGLIEGTSDLLYFTPYITQGMFCHLRLGRLRLHLIHFASLEDLEALKMFR